MTDRGFDRFLRERARDVNRPPPTPREEIWERIEAELATEGAGAGAWTAGPRDRGSPWLGWASAAAALLVLGFGIGRATAPPGAPGSDAGLRPVAGGPGSAASAWTAATGLSEADEAVHGAAVRHLDRTESFLTMVRVDAGSGHVDPAVGRWARGLLLETWLLRDGPTGPDAAMDGLLEDVELILAQVALLAGAEEGARGREELRLIADGLEENDVLGRIRTVLSRSGPANL